MLRTVTTQYDEAGNKIQDGYVLYECEYCKEQYRTSDETERPPAPGGESESIWDKIGNFLGSIFGGLLDLIDSIVGQILDGLTSLVTAAFERLKQLVDLFGEAMGILWTWLPEEITVVLVTGVTVFVFIGLIKVFVK